MLAQWKRELDTFAAVQSVVNESFLGNLRCARTNKMNVFALVDEAGQLVSADPLDVATYRIGADLLALVQTGLSNADNLQIPRTLVVDALAIYDRDMDYIISSSDILKALAEQANLTQQQADVIAKARIHMLPPAE